MSKNILDLIDKLPILATMVLSFTGIIMAMYLISNEELGIVILGIFLYTSAVLTALWFYENVKSISLGFKRLILIINILLSFILGIAIEGDLEPIVMILLISNIGWILVFVGLWINNGFIKNE